MVKMSLRAARVNADRSQKEAAEHFNISNKTLSNWENGVSAPKADKIPEICEYYGVPYDAIDFLPKGSLRANC